MPVRSRPLPPAGADGITDSVAARRPNALPADRSATLRIISVALVATLFAVRRLRVKSWLKILVLAIMAALGLAVLAIELAVH